MSNSKDILLFIFLTLVSFTFRVAAEWIVRNTGAIRFVGHERWITNYNALPQGTKGNYLLEAVNAKAATLTDNGLAHLGKC